MNKKFLFTNRSILSKTDQKIQSSKFVGSATHHNSLKRRKTRKRDRERELEKKREKSRSIGCPAEIAIYRVSVRIESRHKYSKSTYSAKNHPILKIFGSKQVRIKPESELCHYWRSHNKRRVREC